MKRLLILLLAITPLANAGPLHWARHNWKPIIGGAAMFALYAFDAHTTDLTQRRGDIETSIILGPHPSPAHVWELTMSGAAVETGFNFIANRLIRHDSNRFLRDTGPFYIPMSVAVIEGYDVQHNYSILGK